MAVNGNHGSYDSTTSAVARPSIHFFQINLQHCKAATALMCDRLSRMQTFIALIQEPWTTQGGVRGFETLTNCDVHSPICSRQRTCIVASKDLKTTVINHLCDQDTTVVTLGRRGIPGTQNVMAGSV